MKILVTLGQIPAKLDAVKYIGNRFSGKSILKIANALKNKY
jgi:phosphopantothenoylcysteine synthetase/decarboxylase